MEQQIDSEQSLTEQPSPYTLPQVNGYHITRKIQAGGQASIYLSEKMGSQYAMKMYHQSQASINQFKNQAMMLNGLQFKGIVPIVEAIVDASFKENEEEIQVNIIVTPYYANGDLFDYIKSRGILNESTCRFFAKALFQIFLYLHQKNILHGDIKAENILLDDDYKPLLFDFGYSLRMNEKRCKFIGDIRYASPQVIKHIEYTQKSEVYSLGILLYFIITGHYPFSVARVSDPNYRLLLEKKQQIFWRRVEQKVTVDLSDNFKQVFIKMITSNSKNRCSLEEVIEMSWFKQKEITLEQYTASMQESKANSPTKQIYFN